MGSTVSLMLGLNAGGDGFKKQKWGEGGAQGRGVKSRIIPETWGKKPWKRQGYSLGKFLGGKKSLERN